MSSPLFQKCLDPVFRKSVFGLDFDQMPGSSWLPRHSLCFFKLELDGASGMDGCGR